MLRSHKRVVVSNNMSLPDNPIQCPNPSCSGGQVGTARATVAAYPGDRVVSRLFTRLPMLRGVIPLPILLVTGVAALTAAPYWWNDIGWLAVPIYLVLGAWIALRVVSHFALRRGAITVKRNACSRCRYTWGEGEGDRLLEIARFRWEVAQARKSGDRKALAMSLSSLGGLISMYSDDLHEARALLEEGLALRRELGGWESGYTLNNLAFTLYHLGQPDEARPLAEESVGVMREHSEWNGLASALNTLGFILAAQGEGEDAEALFRESLLLQYKMSNWEAIAWNLEGLAAAAFRREDDERAARLYSVAAELRGAGLFFLPPSAQREQDEKVAGLRDRMGQFAFADDWGVGRSMSPDSAVAYALQEPVLSMSTENVPVPPGDAYTS